MRDSIIDDIKLQDGFILCGDGRMDSPGFCATKATYSFMEEGGSHRVVNMEHGDKRQIIMIVHVCICTWYILYSIFSEPPLHSRTSEAP